MKVTFVDKNLARGVLLERRQMWNRLDVVPALVVYISMALAFARNHDIDDEYSLALWLVLIAVAILIHVIVLLLGFWNSKVRAFTQYTPSSSLVASAYVFIEPAPHCGAPSIVELQRIEKAEIELDKSLIDLTLSSRWFVFQKKHFSLDNDMRAKVLEFPTTSRLSQYLLWRGYASAENERRAFEKWGKNEFDIPMPSLEELFMEHALSPFFMFQVFCVSLWCLDEYWYYAIFTLIMLVVFEITVCKQRQLNMGTLRSMRRPVYPIFVFRRACWSPVLSSDLLPGDICSLRSPNESDSSYLFAQHRGSSPTEILVPCDLLLLRGDCIMNEAMLTGESIPKLKEGLAEAVSIDASVGKQILSFEDQSQTSQIILGGTKVMQHTSASKDVAGSIPLPPDGGCIAMVLRTGFYTSQGSLMRTILFSQERVTLDNLETYAFIGVLLIFALMASAYVMVEGLKNEKQSRWKLFLHCTMIITSVVPPELPMELTLAVNTSLARLFKLAIFCTESYRIPWAGKLTICCFDKTGKLTSDDYIVKGVVGDLSTGELQDPVDLNRESTVVLASCHQLVRLGNSVEGDPMELATLRAIHWGITKTGRIVKPGSDLLKLNIIHRFPFSSTLKRMSTVVSCSDDDIEVMVCCKGAPEVLETLLDVIPVDYQDTYRSLMMAGKRVLAMAHKKIPVAEKHLSRNEAESGLIFNGFLVLDSPLKADTADAIRQLRGSGHEIIVITGDNALTAYDVSRQLDLVHGIKEKTLFLECNDNVVEWISMSDARVPFEADNVSLLALDNDLIVTGPALLCLELHLTSDQYTRNLVAICPHVKIFARVSPQHKEFIVAALKAAGHFTMFCGDGTNDVGGLKQAHIGISIINSPEMEQALDNARSRVNAKFVHLTSTERLLHEMNEAQKSGNIVAQLGDASIASAFTSKTPSIMAAVHVIRQGRCTLVTTIQMFKMLALNCLISAYSLSVLHLYGVKQGDTQATIAGLLIAGLFMFISWVKPTQELTHHRPVTQVFSINVAASVFGQLLGHFLSLAFLLHSTLPYMEKSIDPDADFKPNVINTSVFLLALCMQCNVFGVNYRGAPFMESLAENKPFHRVLFGVWTLSLILALDFWDVLNETFELVPIPRENHYQHTLVAIMLANTAFTWSWEWMVRKLLG